MCYNLYISHCMVEDKLALLLPYLCSCQMIKHCSCLNSMGVRGHVKKLCRKFKECLIFVLEIQSSEARFRKEPRRFERMSE
jgi:hypothetical protein